MSTITTQVLRYAHREDDIATIARACDLLGKQDIIGALNILMAYRDAMILAQTPVLEAYDQRAERL